MKLLNLVQGTKEWLDSREEHFTASDAPALMGASKYKTRKQLLDEKKGGRTEVITAAKQALFDKGHKAEDDARSVLELETMDSYSPCVGIADGDLSMLMASFDGRSDDCDHLFEHKLWNETLAENVRNKTLAPSHYWQLEHQLAVDESAEYVLFVVSDGTADKREMMKYYPVPGRKEELIAAWALFSSDLESHEIEAKQELVVASKNNFPVLSCKVDGTEISTNISSCLVEIKDLAEKELIRPFETDQDFADKDQLNKDVKKLREALKQNVKTIKGAFVSYSDFEAVAVEMDSVLQKMYSAGEKQVKQAKEDKKTALKNEAMQSLTSHINECNAVTKAPFSIEQVVAINPDWLSAMKNKRTFDSLKNSLDTVLNEWKLKLNEATKLIAPNFKLLEAEANEYKFLFQDVFSLLNQPEESFKAIVKTRIDDHKKIEAKKLAIETARIEKEAEAKAEAIRKDEREKIALEQKSINEYEEAVKINAEFDEFKANEAKQATISAQPAPKEKAQSMPPTPVNSQKVSATEKPVEVACTVCNGGGCPDCQSSQPISDAITNEALNKSKSTVEEMASQKPLDEVFFQWARDYKINGGAFLALEILINKHFR